MKRIVIVSVSILVVAALVLGGSTALAAKPQSNGSGKDVIAMSNGFPSGPHFNLNIHGKKEGYICEPTEGGGSVFVSINGTSTIEYVTNKKKSPAGNLTVLDQCAGFDGDPAKVQLPYDPEGYWVYARILGTPQNNGKNKDGEPSQIILWPNTVVEACNWNTSTSETDFGNQTSCKDVEWPLGVIVGTNLYEPDPGNATFKRFDPPTIEGKTKVGKGRSIALNITPLFTYTGWAVDASLDIGNSSTGICQVGQDENIDYCDVPVDACDQINGTVIQIDGAPTTVYCEDFYNLDVDGVADAIDIEEWLTFNSMLDEPMAWYFNETWILNIADLVVTGQRVDNSYAKLLQVRFYPRSDTEFVE